MHDEADLGQGVVSASRDAKKGQKCTNQGISSPGDRTGREVVVQGEVRIDHLGEARGPRSKNEAERGRVS